MPIFRGTLEECLNHYAQTNKKSDAAREAMATAVGVTAASTVRRWLAKKATPTGKHRDPLGAYLNGCGYEVIVAPKPKAPLHAQSDVIMSNHVNGDNGKRPLLESAPYLVLALIPLAEHLVSDSCSIAERNKVHEVAGPNSVLKLTALLTRLCSETARKKL